MNTFIKYVTFDLNGQFPVNSQFLHNSVLIFFLKALFSLFSLSNFSLINLKGFLSSDVKEFSGESHEVEILEMKSSDPRLLESLETLYTLPWCLINLVI